MAAFRVIFVLCCARFIQLSRGAQPGSMIPSRDEQQLVLASVQDIFEHAKDLVQAENEETDRAVVADVEKIVKRAQDKLSLVEEMSLIKLSCSRQRRVQIETKSDIQRVTQEGYDLLERCTETADKDIRANSALVTNATADATGHGQKIIDLLMECSRKPSLPQIVCYKKVMSQDVEPLKVRLIESMVQHRRGHEHMIAVRDAANECVDDLMSTYQRKLAHLLAKEVAAIDEESMIEVVNIE